MKVGTGKHAVEMRIEQLGKDNLVTITGANPHIGCVVMCEPGETTKVKVFEKKVNGKAIEHKDYVVIVPIAEKLCKKTKSRVVALGGMHIDNATKEDIEKIIENCKKLEAKI